MREEYLQTTVTSNDRNFSKLCKSSYLQRCESHRTEKSLKLDGRFKNANKVTIKDLEVFKLDREVNTTKLDFVRTKLPLN